MVKINGLDFLHPNTSIEFTAQGIDVRVSLRVNSKMVKYLSPNNVVKSDKRNYHYALHKCIESEYINRNNVLEVQNKLLENCMYWIREAKIKILQDEMDNLKKY